MLPGDQGSRLARDYGLKPQIVPTIEAFPSGSTPEATSGFQGRQESPRPPIRGPRPHDGSRSRAEARLAFPVSDDDLDVVEVGDRRFSLLEITSGLPDNSLEADERAAERALRELRGRVKAARAVVGSSPSIADKLQRDSQRAARFYFRFGITPAELAEGVPALTPPAA
jgi:hypothetical protein